MTSTLIAMVTALLCLVVLPSLLQCWRGFDRSPRTGLMVWAGMCAIGWLAAVVTFLNVGLGYPHASVLRALLLFVRHLGDGHPLRGLGVAEVVGLSVAFDVIVVMLGGLVVTASRIWSVRSQQRAVLDLVAELPIEHEGVCLLRHSYPMAYFVPGDGGRVVLSTGAIEMLSESELRAVIAHEIGHRQGRHGAILVPLQVMASFVSFLPLARYAPTAIRTYLEMSADDYSRSQEPTGSLKTALSKASLFQPAPLGALNVSDGTIERRINRLSVSPIGGRVASLAIALVASVLGCLLLLSH